jgi:hypothetical protein
MILLPLKRLEMAIVYIILSHIVSAHAASSVNNMEKSVSGS